MLSLTATELPRFMVCNGSYFLKTMKPFEVDNTIRDEGNALHWVVEKFVCGQEVIEGDRAPNGIFITGEMLEDVSEYLEYVINAAEKGGIEIETSHSDGVKYEIRGRADHIERVDQYLTVSDFKYGWKIVEPFENWTLMSHAFGWLVKNPDNRPQYIRFKIFQPRPYHPQGSVRTWEISTEQFEEYSNKMVYKLQNPEMLMVCTTSESCYKCPSMTVCPSSQVAVMNSIDVSYQAFNSEINDENLSYMLDEISRASNVLKQALDAYTDLALHRLKSGGKIPNYSIQSGLGQKTWLKNTTVEFVEALTGVNISVKKLPTPNQAIKLGLSEEIVNSLTERPRTGFKLKREDASVKAKKLLQ